MPDPKILLVTCSRQELYSPDGATPLNKCLGVVFSRTIIVGCIIFLDNSSSWDFVTLFTRFSFSMHSCNSKTNFGLISEALRTTDCNGTGHVVSLLLKFTLWLIWAPLDRYLSRRNFGTFCQYSGISIIPILESFQYPFHRKWKHTFSFLCSFKVYFKKI